MSKNAILVRILQRGGSIPSDQLNDLPSSIPVLLPVGTRVTCRVGKRATTTPHQFGGRPVSENLLCQGTVEVVVKVRALEFQLNINRI